MIKSYNNNIAGTNLDIFATAYYALGTNWGKQISFTRADLLEAYEKCNRRKFHDAHRGMFSPIPEGMLFTVHPSSVEAV